jgi:hypothetical protein
LGLHRLAGPEARCSLPQNGFRDIMCVCGGGGGGGFTPLMKWVVLFAFLARK